MPKGQPQGLPLQAPSYYEYLYVIIQKSIVIFQATQKSFKQSKHMGYKNRFVIAF
jgi:hypothetical protein